MDFAVAQWKKLGCVKRQASTESGHLAPLRIQFSGSLLAAVAFERRALARAVARAASSA